MAAASAPPVGENLTSHAFRVRSFHREALALLTRFEDSLAACSTVDGRPDIDVSDLRVPPLQKELEAVSSDAAAGISGKDALDSSAATPAADGGRAAERTLQEGPADCSDAATAAGDAVLLLEAPPGRGPPGPTQQTAAAGPSRRGRTRSATSAAGDSGSGGGDPPNSSRAAPTSKKRVPAGAAQQAGVGGADPPGGADPSPPPSGVHAVGRRVRIQFAGDGSWRAGKITLFNRRSGKHSVRFEDGSLKVTKLTPTRTQFLPEDKADEEDGQDQEAEDTADGVVQETGPAADAARPDAKRSASAMVVYVPPAKRRALKDKGVTFHPDVALQAMDEVKRRRQERVAAAAETLASVAAVLQDAPTFRNREGNFVAAGDAGSKAAATGAEDLPASWSAAEAGDADVAQASLGEVLLRVAVSWPGNAGRIQQEWLVLGSQRLTALRDRLYCRTDRDMAALQLSRPSGFLYVEGTFYVDRRDPDTIDYSEPIRLFCAQNGIGAPAANESIRDGTGYLTGSMEGHTFGDLWLRVGPGSGYVYCHQGCCEHLVTIRDVCLVHPDDIKARLMYPHRHYTSYTRRRECNICTTRLASKVTYDDAQASENPAFWCTGCYEKVHYNAAGNLLYKDFKVFQYLHE